MIVVRQGGAPVNCAEHLHFGLLRRGLNGSSGVGKPRSFGMVPLVHRSRSAALHLCAVRASAIRLSAAGHRSRKGGAASALPGGAIPQAVEATSTSGVPSYRLRRAEAAWPGFGLAGAR